MTAIDVAQVRLLWVNSEMKGLDLLGSMPARSNLCAKSDLTPPDKLGYCLVCKSQVKRQQPPFFFNMYVLPGQTEMNANLTGFVIC